MAIANSGTWPRKGMLMKFGKEEVAGWATTAGPWLFGAIAALGGPVVAGAVVAGGLGYGVYRLVRLCSQ